ncbi:MAG TPA: antibiotic biosynthesis monooxygenase [Azospirillaceae bacterium]|nr:antibiotic biosynthesis monooxygenase [Azospirillaceae bacterium]
MAYVLAWRFTAAAGREEAFRAAYAGDGPWAALFGHADGYLGTELLAAADGRTFLTLDRWASETAFSAFKERFGAEYAALDRECEGLTAAEESLGAYTG